MRFSLAALIHLIVLISTMGIGAEPPAPRPGDIVPDFSFLDTDKVRRHASDLPAREAYVFVFGLLDCPLARRLAPTLASLAREFRPKVEFVGILGTPEDSILDVASYRLDMGLPFLVGKDLPEANIRAPENEVFAGQILGITHSPQVAVLDKDRRLIYRGRVDGRLGVMGSRPTGNQGEGELHRALRLLTQGRPEISETPSEGCSLSFDKPQLPDSHSLTFYKDIQPIVKNHCWDCHRPGGEGPFSLVSYQNVRSHSRTILNAIRSETMPPAFAQKKAYRFLNHREISPEDKLKVESWIRGGMPEGNPSDSSAPPPEMTTWRIGTPDLVLTFKKDFTIKGDGPENYLNARLPGVFLRDTWVEAIEIAPTNKTVTHHANLVFWSVGQFIRTGVGASEKTFLTGYVPGAIPLDTRKVGRNIGVLIPAFSVLGMQLHFVPSGKDETANIKIGIRYARQSIDRRLRNLLFFNPAFKIPARENDFRLSVSTKATTDMDLVGFFPHMHLRGKSMWLDSGTGPRQKRLLEVPGYQFAWQMAYMLRPGSLIIPKGTLLTYHALYDNSDMNTYNPDPNHQVRHGEKTGDEMFMGFLYYLQPGERLRYSINPKTGHRRW